MFNNNNEEKKGRMPDFSSRDGVMIWENKDKNGKPYLSVKIPLMGVSVNCFSTKKDEDKPSDALE